MPYIGKSPSGTGVRTRFLYTATASQTTFSGADTQNLTLSYSDSNFIDVHQNGVLLKIVDDYIATSGTSVVLGTGATADDVIEITVYDIFTVANHVKKSGDNMTGPLTITTDDNLSVLTLESTDADANQGPTLDLFRSSASPAANDTTGKITFTSKNSADEDITYGFIDSQIATVTDGSEQGRVRIITRTAGSLINRLNIEGNETVINDGSANVDFRVESNGNANMIFVDGSDNHVNIGTSTDYGGVLNVLSTDTNDTLTIVSTDNGSSAGPDLVLFRDSSTPADNDFMGTISFRGDDSNGNVSTYAQILSRALDVTSASEDGQLLFVIDKDGTLVSGLNVGSSEVVVNEDSVDIDFRVESNNNANMIFVDGGNDHVNIGTSTDHGGVLNVESTDNGATMKLVSTDDDSDTGPNLHLTRNSASPADDDLIGRIIFNGQNDAGEEVEYANINARIRDASDGTETGRVVFQTTFEGGTGFNRLDFDNNETVINESGANLDFRVEGDADTDLFFVDAGNDAVCINSTTISSNAKFSVNGVKDGSFGRTCLRLRDTDASVGSGNTMMVCDFSGDNNGTNGTYISFRDSGGEIGKVNVAGSASTVFSTSSDYRVKENIKPMTDAWDKIKAINLVNFTFKNRTGPAQDGVIAHELQEIFPQAVTGKKDEMVTRADGTKEMEIQGVDYGKLSTLLAKGLQEAMAKIETLEAKVTALEGK